MTVKMLKENGTLLFEFKKMGYYDKTDGFAHLYRTGDPTYCAIYEMDNHYYFVHRISQLQIEMCSSFIEAMSKFRNFLYCVEV